MEGSVPVKILRLLHALVRRPRDIYPYLLSHSTTPVELGLPWIPYAAIDFLEQWLRPEHTVFEFGSGGSTVFFAQRVQRLVSVEEDDAWLARVASEVTHKALRNVELRASNWDSQNDGAGFLQSDYLSHLAEPADLIFVDGQCWWPANPVRIKCFERARDYVKPGGIIVLDDSWRYDDMLKGSGFKKKRVFKGVGPCRYGVSTTTAYWF